MILVDRIIDKAPKLEGELPVVTHVFKKPRLIDWVPDVELSEVGPHIDKILQDFRLHSQKVSLVKTRAGNRGYYIH